MKRWMVRGPTRCFRTKADAAGACALFAGPAIQAAGMICAAALIVLLLTPAGALGQTSPNSPSAAGPPPFGGPP
ncbi:MAG: hypothetical protein L0H83_07070, partial [Salinisphaera sp.]|nr:hypothetical protein [Salinisphaera sp.]